MCAVYQNMFVTTVPTPQAVQARAAEGTDAAGKVTSTPSTAALAGFVWVGLFVLFVCSLHFVLGIFCGRAWGFGFFVVIWGVFWLFY